MLDVLVIGGGPIGSYTAYQLGAEGFEVAVIEKKRQIGSGVVCSGIIGADAFRRYDLPQEPIVYQMDRVQVYSPKLSLLEFTSEVPLAYVVDRALYDRVLYELAKGQGVAYFTGHRVEAVQVGEQGVEVSATNGGSSQVFRARCCILATGTHYRLHRQVGLDTPSRFLLGAQVSGAVAGLEGPEVYVGSEVAPGSFGWAVPAGGNGAKVGVMVYERPRAYLRRFLETRLNGRGDWEGQTLELKPISNALVAKATADRVLAVGEAAGQVKTTTGGGLYFGLIGSELAVQVLKEAFHRGDFSKAFLSEYDRLWHAELAQELELGLAFRQAISRLDDGRIEFLLGLLAKNWGIKEFLLRKFQFDSHGEIIKTVLNYLGKFSLLSRFAGRIL